MSPGKVGAGVSGAGVSGAGVSGAAAAVWLEVCAQGLDGAVH